MSSLYRNSFLTSLLTTLPLLFHLFHLFLLFPSATAAAAASSSLFATRADQAPSSTEYTSDDAFKEATLNVTNTYRKQHNATSLRWNESLAEFAGKVTQNCVFEHSGGPFGENLASGYPNASASLIAWGHERVSYDFSAGAFSHETGHFTQLVWKASSTVGCARKECNGDGGNKAPGWYLVCEYYPAGNVLGQFKQNVQEEVPQNEQPQGPSDPEVPQDEGGGGKGGSEECPQGAACDAAGVVRTNMFALWVAVCVGVLFGT